MDIIKSADYIIDLGPEGGERGGLIVGSGLPEEIAFTKKSYTGKFLKEIMPGASLDRKNREEYTLPAKMSQEIINKGG